MCNRFFFLSVKQELCTKKTHQLNMCSSKTRNSVDCFLLSGSSFCYFWSVPWAPFWKHRSWPCWRWGQGRSVFCWPWDISPTRDNLPIQIHSSSDLASQCRYFSMEKKVKYRLHCTICSCVTIVISWIHLHVRNYPSLVWFPGFSWTTAILASRACLIFGDRTFACRRRRPIFILMCFTGLLPIT